MNFQMMWTHAVLAAMLVCCTVAAPTEVGDNATTTESSSSEGNETMPFIIVMEEVGNDVQVDNESEADYAARDLQWLVIRKITNISRVEEISTNDETGKTKKVLAEDRAEEYRVFRDDRHRQILDESDFKSVSLPFQFL